MLWFMCPHPPRLHVLEFNPHCGGLQECKINLMSLEVGLGEVIRIREGCAHPGSTQTKIGSIREDHLGRALWLDSGDFMSTRSKTTQIHPHTLCLFACNALHSLGTLAERRPSPDVTLCPCICSINLPSSGVSSPMHFIIVMIHGLV